MLWSPGGVFSKYYSINKRNFKNIQNMNQRTTNNLGGDGENRSSVKLHHAPGGKSNFTIGWDPEPQPQRTGGKALIPQPQSYGAGSNNITGGYDQRSDAYGGNQSSNQYGNQSGNQYGNQSGNQYGNQPSNQSSNQYGGSAQKQDTYATSNNAYGNSPTKTSVKVHHAPGGQSNFSLGNEQSNYGNQGRNDYGKGRDDYGQGRNNYGQGQGQGRNDNEYVKGPEKTSVKVHAPPGGKSNFTLG